MNAMKFAFPISRDPPEGGTYSMDVLIWRISMDSFQFLGIPPKGEREEERC